MDTAAISYRVADFLKQHPPFNAIDEADLLALAARGRVRFHEPNEYILWQREPHRPHVFVIQQGTVSLWDEADDRVELRDVRGAGDMLGIERYTDAPSTLYSARSQSDVVIYAFPEEDFRQYVLTHPHAAQYVAAEGRVTTEYQGAAVGHAPHRTFLRAITATPPLATCHAAETIAAVAGRLLATGAHAVAVVEPGNRLRAILAAETLLQWVAAGGGDAHRHAIGTLLHGTPAVVAPEASVTDGVLAMGSAGGDAVAITADGTATGPLQALVTSSDLAVMFGDQPTAILRDIRLARSLSALRAINQRARSLAQQYLTSAAAVEWLAALTHLVDTAILTRILALHGIADAPGCWCCFDASGRGESLTPVAPHLLVMVANEQNPVAVLPIYERVLGAFAACGYLASDRSFETSFYVANAWEWTRRYRGWMRDPVMQDMSRARTLFDLRPVLGQMSLWHEHQTALAAIADRDFLHVLAHDCLATLPPLTFYEDDVVDSVGEHGATFRLEQSALRPLVDVARVFGMAGGVMLGRSTLDRFATARTVLPEHEQIFREAADTFRVVLWQQGKVGIAQGTSGDELPPALLSRQDRQVLKSGFRAIRRLIEFTADRSWLQTL